MATEEKPIVALVHGAFAESASWNGVIERLSARSVDAIAIGNPLRSLAGDAAYVRDVIAHLARPVVLVGHSYGGMVITGAADRAEGRVGKLVYLDAANPRNGQSLLDVAGPVIGMTRPSGRVVDGVELVLWPGEGAASFYGITDPEDLAWVRSIFSEFLPDRPHFGQDELVELLDRRPDLRRTMS